MKYFSLTQIDEAIKQLASVHPFFLITFLTAKKAQFPVGGRISIQLDRENDEFLRAFYKLHPKSNWFFTPYKGANKNQTWLKPDYSSSGLQAINTQTFRDAFDHPANTALWGWKPEYVSVLKGRLKNKTIPIFPLVVWIGRNTPYSDDFHREDCIEKFIADFQITQSEIDALFDLNINSGVDEDDAFSEVPVPWNAIIAPFSMPPDVGPDAEALLTYIALQSLGPIKNLECHPASRLNLITGDNGVGKTFLLDAVWWALTNSWVDFPILPRPNSAFVDAPKITFQLAGTILTHKARSATYDVKQGWKLSGKHDVAQSLVLYCRSDGAFALWDPARYDVGELPGKIRLERDEVWFGKAQLIEGLLRDLVSWSHLPDSSVFDLFLRTLARLSPPEMPTLTLGAAVRISGYSQLIPTIKHPYGEVPLIFESAGIKRMVAMAYLIVWAWTEHKTLAQDLDRNIASRLVLLVDELEAHLHPKWQRTVLPALLLVLSDLSSNLDS